MRHMSGARGIWLRARHRVVAILAMLVLLLAACAGGPTSSRPASSAHGVTPHGPTATVPPSRAAADSAARLQLQLRQSADWYLGRMSLDEKLGQMFLIETVWQDYNQDVDNVVRGMHAGALILYQQNMANPAQ
ncbi:MAG TPA: hypothetical protein VJQ45_09235, partial [Ktedonobacterales bacterium]|nr:hypothetical protein [Ktedonobacterales bacterium]